MAIETQILSRLSRRSLRRSRVLSRPSTSVENPLQISPFYAKQTQFSEKSNGHKSI